MECAGNGRAKYTPRPISQPWLTRRSAPAAGAACGCATCSTVRLREPAPSRCCSPASIAASRAARSRPSSAACRSTSPARRRILAYDLNGAPLPPQHGFPLRLLVPGWYGMTNVKWLARITLVDKPFEGYQQARGYHFRADEDDPGVPLQRIRPRALWCRPASRSS